MRRGVRDSTDQWLIIINYNLSEMKNTKKITMFMYIGAQSL